MIQLIELTKDFGKVRAVDRLSFTINKGEIFGLLGENGAGKTTTLRMLATMIKPTHGTAIIDGLDITKEPEKVRRKIGILFGSESGLYSRLTARENIEYFATLHDMKKDEIKKRIDELVERFQMQEFIDKPAGKFSKGMKQKVCFVRSIIHDPDVMLFDEPTNSLDVTSAKEVHDFIRLCKQEGRTIIFSSHTMSEVEKLCDRVAIIHKGKLVAIGTIDEIKQRFSGASFEDVFIRLVGDNR
ncbi:ABC transporter related protein [Caldicellulosiruptor saccharolyticus DSM 8903]|uniref:ABC transporter related protein n=1 Tax=Caldicellulosiruptor saccharolyticus (strain ATCC 43494 / DSM 8903 / Tp8T 6331) TaxID=351627 RepID=A4XME4_CALS8|nr:ATP-binding cassette domain-containing protein [Caldicellulosiruptor saccharolyticus]ABP68079.1 ABC transporter related protein [Caldicellulosiruptor saccharolyticus DSM 8903]